MKKAVIIEDSPAGVSNLKNLLALVCKDVEVVASASNIREALLLLNQPDYAPDIAFLDIELKDGLAFDLLEQIPERTFEIIFVSAYNKYADQACNHRSVGYLHKPIDPDKLTQAVGRACASRKFAAPFSGEDFPGHAWVSEHLSVQAQGGWHFFYLPEIIYLFGENNCTWFFLRDGRKLFVCTTLGEYEKQLERFPFYRIRKNAIVNLYEVEKLTPGDNCFAQLRNGVRLKVARRRRPALLSKLKALDF
ncbi:MAG: LytTR family DNA-binding domain-containing protein [Bacteroidota bacterium]